MKKMPFWGPILSTGTLNYGGIEMSQFHALIRRAQYCKQYFVKKCLLKMFLRGICVLALFAECDL